MTKFRVLSLGLTLELLALLLLTQSWFDISMAPNGEPVSLGSFDGATTYAVAMPLSLFALAAILVALITSRATQLIVIGLSMVSVFAAIMLLAPAIFSKNIASLDTQLARLTGIANTHGISDLTIGTTYAPIAWLLVQLLTGLWLAAALIWQRRWPVADKTTPVDKSTKQKTDGSTISLWDNQRS
jgi:uncharacterized membrane protein (TIGR02234 family)